MATEAHSKQHVMRIEKCLDKKKCEKLISLFSSEEYKSKIKKGPPNDYCNRRNIHFYEYIQLNPALTIFTEELINGLRKYSEKHSFLKRHEWGLVNECRIQKYLPGESYSVEHCEQGQGKVTSLIMIAWMFYLNSIPTNEGGGTQFPQQNFKAEPREGDLWIWPAFWTHSHKGEPTLTKDKYIITGWCRYKEEIPFSQ